MDEQNRKSNLQLDGIKAILFLVLLFGVFTYIGLYLIAEQIAHILNAIQGDGLTAYDFFTSIISMAIGVFLIRLEWCWFSEALAEYEPLPNGFKVKYPLRSSVIYAWDEFQQVCICYSNYTTKGRIKANTVICLVKKGEQPNYNGRWKTDNPFRYRSVISMDYSEELHQRIQEKYPHAIADLRQTPAYKI